MILNRLEGYHVCGHLLHFIIQAEYSRLDQSLNFIIKGKAILSRMSYDPIILAIFGFFVHLTSTGLLGLGSSILLLLTNMLKILSTYSSLNEYSFCACCDRAVLCQRDELFLGFVSVSIANTFSL